MNSSPGKPMIPLAASVRRAGDGADDDFEHHADDGLDEQRLSLGAEAGRGRFAFRVVRVDVRAEPRASPEETRPPWSREAPSELGISLISTSS